MPVEYREFGLWAFGEQCDVCGAEEGIVVHHITSGGMDATLADLIPLCRSCHQYVHHGLPVDDPQLARLQSRVLVQTTIPSGMVYDCRRRQWYFDGKFLTVDEAIAEAHAHPRD